MTERAKRLRESTKSGQAKVCSLIIWVGSVGRVGRGLVHIRWATPPSPMKMKDEKNEKIGIWPYEMGFKEIVGLERV